MIAEADPGSGVIADAAAAKAKAAHLLVVDDDARIRQLLQRFLTRSGFWVSVARDAAQARRLLEGLEFDMLILDVMMPGEDGVALTGSLRETMQTPILLLTARGDADDRIRGLEAGADDYLPKPFDPRELQLRITAILRRVPKPAPRPGPPQTLHLGPVRYDVGRGELWRGNEPIRLTATQWRLLEVLAQQAGRVVTARQLLREVWGPGHAEQGHYLRIYVRQLRQKLEAEPGQPAYLMTDTGIGYRLLTDA